MNASVNEEGVVDDGESDPALINVEQAAEIAHCPPATIRGWSSAGRLDGFVRFVLGELAERIGSQPYGDRRREARSQRLTAWALIEVLFAPRKSRGEKGRSICYV